MADKKKQNLLQRLFSRKSKEEVPVDHEWADKLERRATTDLKDHIKEKWKETHKDGDKATVIPVLRLRGKNTKEEEEEVAVDSRWVAKLARKDTISLGRKLHLNTKHSESESGTIIPVLLLHPKKKKQSRTEPEDVPVDKNWAEKLDRRETYELKDDIVKKWRKAKDGESEHENGALPVLRLGKKKKESNDDDSEPVDVGRLDRRERGSISRKFLEKVSESPNENVTLLPTKSIIRQKRADSEEEIPIDPKWADKISRRATMDLREHIMKQWKHNDEHKSEETFIPVLRLSGKSRKEEEEEEDVAVDERWMARLARRDTVSLGHKFHVSIPNTDDDFEKTSESTIVPVLFLHSKKHKKKATGSPDSTSSSPTKRYGVAKPPMSPTSQMHKPGPLDTRDAEGRKSLTDMLQILRGGRMSRDTSITSDSSQGGVFSFEQSPSDSAAVRALDAALKQTISEMKSSSSEGQSKGGSGDSGVFRRADSESPVGNEHTEDNSSDHISDLSSSNYSAAFSLGIGDLSPAGARELHDSKVLERMLYDRPPGAVQFIRHEATMEGNNVVAVDLYPESERVSRARSGTLPSKDPEELVNRARTRSRTIERKEVVFGVFVWASLGN